MRNFIKTTALFLAILAGAAVSNAQTPVIGAQGSLSSNASSIRGWCGGTGTSSATLALYLLGSITTGCTGTVSNTGAFLAAHGGTFKNLYVFAGTGGVNSSSGVVTLYDNGVATTLTCTLGTGTSCNDTTHTPLGIAGHLYTLRFTTQASETLANIAATFEFQ